MDHAPVAITSAAGSQRVPRGVLLLQELSVLLAAIVVMVVAVEVVIVFVLMVRLQTDAVERAADVCAALKSVLLFELEKGR